ncbi:glycosyl hydrolase family 95 catalytic domain-containing protein [Paenibacillus taichungensis]|uniref:glycosyl hydrolase family 95 catalytic domain-containing protein n=1 Tax=Paenibacillus taichungensis TaxID=484184 RepID=UPI0039A50370
MVAVEWKQRVEKYKGIFTEPPKIVPSDKVVDSPVIGNGDLGVTISGKPEQQRIWISKTDFWKAQLMYSNGSPCLLGGIDIHMPDLANASYYSEQRLDEAKIVSTFHGAVASITMTSWISAMENALIVELSCDKQAVAVTLDLWVQPGNGSETEQGQDGDTAWAARKFTGEGIEWPTEGVIALRCSSGSQSFELKPGTKQYIIAYVVTNHDEENYLQESIRKVGLYDENRIASLRSEHADWWSGFWSKSAIEIGDELLEKFWFGSHYIMACCSRNKKFAPGLFGNWITTDNPEWAGDYHLNYNYQAPWWGVYSSNHIELSEPYDTPLLEYMPNGRRYAEEYLGCRGLYYDVGIGPKGLPTALCNTPYENGHMFLGQKSNSVLSTVNMLMRFYYTYDLEYAGLMYPFLIEVANFWEDYLTFEDGRYVIYCDAIHEVGTYTESHDNDDWDRGLEDMNPILSLALIRMLFKGLLDISGQLQLDGDRHEKWTHVLEHMSDYPTFEREGKMIFRLTEQGHEWWGDNTLAIQHIWPAGGIGLDSDPQLLEIAKDTITVLNRWTDYNGFPTIFTAAARVGYEPETILRELRRQCSEHSFPNLFIFFGGGGIECCSGVPSAINEMLLQSHEQVIKLFPVWPQEKDARFHNLRAVGAFIVSSELSEGKVTHIDLTSDKGRACSILNPWPNGELSVVEIDSAGNQQREIEWQLSENIISFNTEAGKSYRLLGH